MLKILISSFIIFTSFNLSADFKNTNGKALEKSLGQMLEWMGSDVEPEITKIKLSDSVPHEVKNISEGKTLNSFAIVFLAFSIRVLEDLPKL